MGRATHASENKHFAGENKVHKSIKPLHIVRSEHHSVLSSC